MASEWGWRWTGRVDEQEGKLRKGGWHLVPSVYLCSFSQAALSSAYLPSLPPTATSHQPLSVPSPTLSYSFPLDTQGSVRGHAGLTTLMDSDCSGVWMDLII